nr:immunoglobulin light chain junction region [Macaca mulatta]
CLQDTRLPPTF